MWAPTNLLLWVLLIGVGVAQPACAAAPVVLEALWCKYGLQDCGGGFVEEGVVGVAEAAQGPEPQLDLVAGTRLQQQLFPDELLREANQLLEWTPAASSAQGALVAGAEARGRMLQGLTAARPGVQHTQLPTQQQQGAQHAARLLLDTLADAASLQAATKAVNPKVTAAAAAAAADAGSVAAVAAPAWALALLGLSCLLLLAVQIASCTAHAVAARRKRLQHPSLLQQQDASTTMDVLEAGGLAQPGAWLDPAPVQQQQQQQPAIATPAAASVQSKAIKPLRDKIRWAPGSPRSGGSSPRSPGSPSRSAGASSPHTRLSVDPSVKARDLSAVGWAETAATFVVRRGSSFLNPLYSGAGVQGSVGRAAGSGAASPIAAAVGGSLPLDKQGAMLLHQQVAQPTDFQLAAAVGSPQDSGVPQPESTGQPTQRKLTGAKSIGPNEVRLQALPEEHAVADLEQRGDTPAAEATHNASSAACSSDHQHCSALSTAMASPSAAASTASSSNLLCLTPQQFQREVALVRLLGSGASGCVYQADWRGQQVAVKLLHPTFQVQTASNARDAFRREAELAARLAHTGVVRTLAACLDPPAMCLVQQLQEGGSLWDALHGQGRRPRYATLLQLLEDSAAAMAYCHEQRVVHRDLCTRNVLLGADGRARIGDWGLAQCKNSTYLTQGRGAQGTAAYAAPEVFNGGPLDERCDVFSWGCVVWELLTGQEPWGQLPGAMQVIMAVSVERRRLPIPPDCPPLLARLLKECWRHNAPLRPGFSEIVARLRLMRREDSSPQQQSRTAAATPPASPAPKAVRAPPTVARKFSPTRQTVLKVPLGGRAAIWHSQVEAKCDCYMGHPVLVQK